jgi:hypothetical protein
MFDQLGAPMHEEQSSLSGTVNALGWDWDMSTNMLVCPLDKYTNCLRLSAEWALRASANEVFTFNEIDSIAAWSFPMDFDSMPCNNPSGSIVTSTETRPEGE